MKKIAFIIVLGCIANWAIAQTAHRLLRDGNGAYEAEDYATAAEKYYKALEKDPDNINGKFNLGNATYQTNGYDEAIQHFSAAAELAKDEQTKADAYYNLGNALFQKAKQEQGKGLEKSVEAYKKSLRLNPKDIDTKKNLALSQRLLVQQQQQKQQQQQDKKDQDQKDKDKKENQQKNDDQQKNDNQQQNDQQKNEKQQDQNEKQQQEQAKDLSKEEALELLKIMDEEEKKVQEKMRRAKGSGKKPEKDW